MSKWRRYLYLLLDHSSKENYPLRRIDASTLFCPANQKITPTEIEDARLPAPFISFTASPTAEYGSRVLDFFTLFGRGEGEKKSLVAGADENGLKVMYDLARRTVHYQVRLNEPKDIDAVSLAVGDSLYVIERTPLLRSRCGFEALVYDGEQYNEHDESIWEWRWRRLEPPPYVLAPGYKPTPISAYTVVGGSDIWISTPDIGTYSFSTSAGTWSRAGKWVLPFRGRADYIPECSSWLGFSSRSGLLCSVDLSTASERAKPKVSGVLEEVMQECKGWILSRSYLVRLGSARFCVARFFDRQCNHVTKEGYVYRQRETSVIFTGFVMDLDGPGGSLRMTKHKSRRYMIPDIGIIGIGWVF